MHKRAPCTCTKWTPNRELGSDDETARVLMNLGSLAVELHQVSERGSDCFSDLSSWSIAFGDDSAVLVPSVDDFRQLEFAVEVPVSHDGVFDNRMMGYSTEELWFSEWENGGTLWANPQGYEQFNPVNHVAEWTVPMLVIHSSNDFRIPIEQGIGAFSALQRKGVPSEFLTFPNENHWCSSRKIPCNGTIPSTPGLRAG